MENKEARKSRTFTQRATRWTAKWALVAAVFAGVPTVYFGGFPARTITAQNTTPVAEASTNSEVEKLRGLPIEVLEDKLVEIVWGGESQKLVLKQGEILQTFDPADSEYQTCIKEGGRQPKYCISWGPYQIKMSTIQHYYPKVYDGKTLTDIEAIQFANDNEKARRFFLDCSVKVPKCANEWSTFQRHATEGQVYIDLLREVK